MSLNQSYVFDATISRLLVDYVKLRYASFNLGAVRKRLTTIDKAIQLEMEERRSAIPSFYDDTMIPIVESPVTTTTGFLVDLYLSNPSVFEAVSKDPKSKEAVTAMNAIISENSSATGWTREFANFFRSTVKYNIAGLDVAWEGEQAVELTTFTGTGSNSSGSAVEIQTRQGNRIRAKDMYNTFYDTSVDASQVHRYGEFVGEIESISMVELARRIQNMKLSDGKVMSESAIWTTASASTNQYYTPTIVNTGTSKSDTALSGFFGLSDVKSKDNKKTFTTNRYEVVTFYARIIPSMFGITPAMLPGADKLQIWKLVVVNWDTLLYAEKQTNAHNFLPSLLCQPVEDGIGNQVKSLAEKIIPMQNLATKLYDARSKSLRRAVSDRGIYMQGVIDKKDIDSSDPKANIPMRPNVFAKDVRQAYAAIPYRDDVGSVFLNEINFLQRLADTATLSNKPQQGQFQKGNKTAQEYNDVMANADTNSRVMALLIESQMMQPLKTIVKTNILQYQDIGAEVVTPQGETLAIDTTALREAVLSFKLADGLRTKNSIIDPSVLDRFLQLLMTAPQLQQQYSLPQLIDYMLGLDGVDLAQFANAAEAPATAPAGTQEGQPNE